MRVTPYGVKPYMKMLITRRAKKKGWVSIGIPNKGYDENEEEQ